MPFYRGTYFGPDATSAPNASVAIDPKQTSDNAVAFFSFWRPSELSRIRFEPFIMRVVTIEADERRRMNNENTRRGGSAAHRRGPSRSKLQQEVAELAAQKAAISEVLRAIASSPHDLQPIFKTIIDSAVRLCRGEGGTFRLVEEAGLRLVAYSLSRGGLKEYSPPMLQEHGSFIGRQIASKSPVNIPDIAANEVYSAGDANRVALVEAGFRTILLVPMLRNDELVGAFAIGWRRIEHVTENEIELVTDFAAQAAIENQSGELPGKKSHTSP